MPEGFWTREYADRKSMWRALEHAFQENLTEEEIDRFSTEINKEALNELLDDEQAQHSDLPSVTVVFSTENYDIAVTESSIAVRSLKESEELVDAIRNGGSD